MNKLTPYEESLSQDLGDLPVPSADKGWQEMQRLLDKDDDNRGIILPPQLRGCLIPGLLLGVILAGAVYFIHPQKWFASNKNRPVDTALPASNKMDQVKGNKPSTATTAILTDTDLAPEKETKNDVAANDQGNSVTSPSAPTVTDKGSKIDIQPTPTSAANENVNPDNTTAKGSRTLTQSRKDTFKKNAPMAGINSDDNNDTDSKTTKQRRSRSADKNSRVTITAPPAEETGDIGKNSHEKVPDPISKENIAITDEPEKQKEAIKKADSTSPVVSIPVDSVQSKKLPGPKKKKYYFGAGLTVYKGLPLNGDIDAAVNNSGRKNAASDYIPSVYARFYKDKKWFIQGEFRYGVPQYTRAFVYKQNQKTDAQQNTTTSSYKLRKTYYHQVPVSFNYFISSGWSVGTGIIYNRFYGALSSESVRKANMRLVNDSLVSFNVINDRNDSSFARNTFQWLIETQYKWKRFSFGARYARGLQPYIKYTDPETNLQVSRKSNSLYLFLRYELWNSKK